MPLSGERSFMMRFSIVLLSLVLAATDAFAEARLEARYTVSVTGVAIGQGALVIEFNGDGYSAAGSAAVTGLMKLVAPGKGSAAARGTIMGGKVLPATYSVTSESGDKSEDIRMSLAGGAVREAIVLPPVRSSSGRVPVTEEHRKGVVDPMSAAIMPVTGNADPAGVAACDRTLQIFDGRYRYDLIMQYETTDVAKDIKGYSGRLAVCRVLYEPVAGHRLERPHTKQLRQEQKIFAWLAPVSGTKVLVPARVTMETRVGKLIVQATQFATENRVRSDVAPGGSK